MPAFCQAAVWTPLPRLLDNRVTSFLLKHVADFEASGGEKSMRLRPSGLRIVAASMAVSFLPFGAVGATKNGNKQETLFPFYFLVLRAYLG